MGPEKGELDEGSNLRLRHFLSGLLEQQKVGLLIRLHQK